MRQAVCGSYVSVTSKSLEIPIAFSRPYIHAKCQMVAQTKPLVDRHMKCEMTVYNMSVDISNQHADHVLAAKHTTKVASVATKAE